MPNCYLNFMHYMRLILRVKKYVASDKLNVRMNWLSCPFRGINRFKYDAILKKKRKRKERLLEWDWAADVTEWVLLVWWQFPVKGPPASAAFIEGGDQLGLSARSVSKSPWITLSTQRKQTVKGGSAGAKRGALLCYFSFQLSIVSSSVWASGHGAGQGGVY